MHQQIDPVLPQHVGPSSAVPLSHPIRSSGTLARTSPHQGEMSATLGRHSKSQVLRAQTQKLVQPRFSFSNWRKRVVCCTGGQSDENEKIKKVPTSENLSEETKSINPLLGQQGDASNFANVGTSEAAGSSMQQQVLQQEQTEISPSTTSDSQAVKKGYNDIQQTIQTAFEGLLGELRDLRSDFGTRLTKVENSVESIQTSINREEARKAAEAKEKAQETAVRAVSEITEAVVSEVIDAMAPKSHLGPIAGKMAKVAVELKAPLGSEAAKRIEDAYTQIRDKISSQNLATSSPQEGIDFTQEHLKEVITPFINVAVESSIEATLGVKDALQEQSLTSLKKVCSAPATLMETFVEKTLQAEIKQQEIFQEAMGSPLAGSRPDVSYIPPFASISNSHYRQRHFRSCSSSPSILIPTPDSSINVSKYITKQPTWFVFLTVVVVFLLTALPALKKKFIKEHTKNYG